MIVHEPEESERTLLSGAVRDLARRTRFPVVFGGLVRDDTAQVTTILGNRTRALDGLAVRLERGLGGRAMAELRPRMTGDYGSARQITHDYDGYILGEGIGPLLAVPVVVNGRARGVLYGGAWGGGTIGDVTATPAVEVADSLATELRIRDEVARRVERESPARPPADLSPAHREQLRSSYAELRRIAADISDEDLRRRITEVERRIAAVSAFDPSGPQPEIHLSPRETDVLACAALGSRNADIARELGLREGTVKAYLGSAMAKLDANTRHAAVTKARMAGILP